MKHWTLDELTAVFAAMGATDPASWARSQVDEGIPQLHRFAFLKAMWAMVERQNDAGWPADLAAGNVDRPDPAAAAAVTRMTALGVDPADVAAVANAARAEMVYFLAAQIDDPYTAAEDIGYPGDAADVEWGLFVTGADGTAGPQIDGLHESANDVGPGRD